MMTRDRRGDPLPVADRGPTAFPESRKSRIAATALAAILLGFDKEALAHIEYSKVGSGKEFNLVYKSEKDDKKYNLRFTSLENFGTKLTEKKIHDPFLENIRKRDTPTVGVNYSILNRPAFDSFIRNDSLRSRERLGLAWSSMSELKPRDVLLMAAEMTDWNIRNQPAIDPKSKDFNPFLFFKSNFMPLDLVDEGVCRHFSSKSKVIARKLIEFSNSPFLQNVAVDEVVADNHAWNIFYEFTMEDGDPTISMVYYDPLRPAVTAPRQISTQTLEAFKPPYQNILATMTGKFFDYFTDEEKRKTLQHIFLLQEKGEPNFSILKNQLDISRALISALLRDGREREARELLLDTHQFLIKCRDRGIDYRSNSDAKEMVRSFYTWLKNEQVVIKANEITTLFEEAL
ncbi:hypothetical protein HYV71_00365 [Candidatus Uhrbacteria bacterium]|nr:hypothetical protein [Candidatus Uhrbacteria bacterium]